jgi:germacradienol/geosmin synthase
MSSASVASPREFHNRRQSKEKDREVRIKFEMPPVSRPYASKVHPGISRLEDHLNAWIREYDLARTPASWDRYTQTRFHELVARGFPEVADLTAIGEWYNFLWFWDDQLDDGLPLRSPEQLSQVIEELMAMLPIELDTAPAPPNGLAAAIGNLWIRVAPPMSPAWRWRFANSARNYLDSYRTPLAMQRDKPAPDLRTYVAFRRITGAMETVYPLLEAVEGLEIPGPVFVIPEFNALLDAANDVTVWTNDIASARKELAHGETTNFVAVLRSQLTCEWQEAANLTAKMIAKRLQEFLSLEKRVDYLVVANYGSNHDITTGIRRYMMLIKDWLSGSRDWHLDSYRYRKIEYLVPGAQHAYMDPLLPLDRTELTRKSSPAVA